MISYAGVPLVVPKLSDWSRLARVLDGAMLGDMERASWPGDQRRRWSWPGQTLPRPVKPMTLWWPNGASRWAVGRFFVTDHQLATIRQSVQSGTAAELLLDDGVRQVRTQMFMLPNRPVYQVEDGLYLLTLVDERYRWWEKTLLIRTSLVEDNDESVWTYLYDSIATALGITLSYGSVSASYLRPSPALICQYEMVPLLLDAIAYCTGKRITRSLDGTVKAQDPLDALARVLSLLSTNGWHKHTGGAFALNAFASPNDLNQLVPSSVFVYFPLTKEPHDLCDPYTIEVTLASLSLSQYSGVTGHTGKKIFRDGVFPARNKSGTLLNGSEMSALATKIASDWYLWQLGYLDWSYAGLVAYDAEALHDGVEWTHEPDKITTRVIRRPFNDQVEDLPHTGTYGSNWGVVTSPQTSRVRGTFLTSGYQDGYLCKWDRQAQEWIDVQPIWLRENEDAILPRGYWNVTFAGCYQNRPIYRRALEEFPARLTAVLGTAYGWVEQTYEPTGQFADKINSRSGTTTDNPAYERNMATTVPMGSIVWIRRGYWEDGDSDAQHEWLFDYEVGGVVTVNVIDVTTINITNNYIENTFYFNCYDARMYLVACGNTYVFCPCDSTSGSGDGGDECAGSTLPCGTCVDRTAISWATTIAGFGGDCATFNGDWTFTQIGACEWAQNKGSGLEGRVYFSGGRIYLILYNASVPVRVSAYTDFAGDCCSPATLTVSSFAGCSSHPTTITLTPDCCGDAAGGGSSDTDCCPGEPVADVLKVLVTSKTGTCSCWPDQFDIFIEGGLGSGGWVASINPATNPCSVGGDFNLFCTTGGTSCSDFRLSMARFGVNILPPDSCVCSPTQIVFANVSMSDVVNGCTGTATFTIVNA